MALARRRPGLLLVLVALAAAFLVAPVSPARADGEETSAAAAAAAQAEEAYRDALERVEGIQDDLVQTIDKVRINSVTVLNLKRVPKVEPPEFRRVSGGSGVIVKSKGQLWILTNVHVTKGAEKLQVITHDGETRDVELHDSIPEYDIALMRFAEKPRGVQFKGVDVQGRNSSSKLKEGTWVIATGNPFFLAEDGRSVVTLGVVSGLDRFLGGEFQYVGAIQHDAEVNPGNSGGPLWNLKGDLVGINGKIATGARLAGVRPTNTGAAFSLPVHQVEAYLTRLVGSDDAQAGYLGVNTETAMDDKGKAIGARVVSIDKGSPLAQDKDAPQAGDLITHLVVRGSSKTIYTATDLLNHVSVLAAGTDVTIKFRSGKRFKRWKGALGDRKR